MSRLIGSAKSLELLLELMKSRMYWSTVNVVPVTGGDGYHVANSKGIVDGYRVRLVGKRWRLEIIGE